MSKLIRKFINKRQARKAIQDKVKAIQSWIEELKEELEYYKHDEKMQAVIRKHLHNRYNQLDELMNEIIEA